MGKNEVSTTISPNLLPGEAFQTSVQGEGTQTEASILSELRKQSSAFREAKAARIPRAQDQRKGSCMDGGGLQRERKRERAWRSAEGSLQSLLLNSGWEKNHQKGVGG